MEKYTKRNKKKKKKNEKKKYANQMSGGKVQSKIIMGYGV